MVKYTPYNKKANINQGNKMDVRTPKPRDYLLYNHLMQRYETYTIMISWLDAYHSIDAEGYVKVNKIKPNENFNDGKTISEQPLKRR